MLNLLAVEFETDTPAGVVKLLFSGGGVLRLEVECLEAELADLGPTWAVDTRARPMSPTCSTPGVDAFGRRPSPSDAARRRLQNRSRVITIKIAFRDAGPPNPPEEGGMRAPAFAIRNIVAPSPHPLPCGARE